MMDVDAGGGPIRSAPPRALTGGLGFPLLIQLVFTNSFRFALQQAMWFCRVPVTCARVVDWV
jgi:hypothetical protein